jgi:hypothetical protein
VFEICVTLKGSLASAMPKSWQVRESRGVPVTEPTALEGWRTSHEMEE